MKNPFKSDSKTTFSEVDHSKGILDDFKTGKVVETKELIFEKAYPRVNSVSGMTIAQADGTNFVTFDTTNKRVGINAVPLCALYVGDLVETDIHGINQLRVGRRTDTDFYWSMGRDNNTTGDLIFTSRGTDRVRFLYAGGINALAGNIVTTGVLSGATIQLSGKITNYNSLPTEGYGVPAIVDYYGVADLGINITTTNFTNASTAGLYRLSYTIFTSVADPDNFSEVTFEIGWTDDTGARTFRPSGTPIILDQILTTGGYFQQGVMIIQNAGGNITYDTTISGTYETGRYSLYMTLERLN